MTCKIAKCAADIYRANLCRAHYQFWVDNGELPGAVKAGYGSLPIHLGDRKILLANAVAQAAQKWAAHDDALRAALEAWEDAK